MSTVPERLLRLALFKASRSTFNHFGKAYLEFIIRRFVNAIFVDGLIVHRFGDSLFAGKLTIHRNIAFP